MWLNDRTPQLLKTVIPSSKVLGRSELHLWITPYSRVTDLSLVNLEWFGIVIDFPGRKTAWTSGSWKIRSKRCASGSVWWQCSRRPMIYQLTGTEGWLSLFYQFFFQNIMYHHVTPKEISMMEWVHGSPGFTHRSRRQACEWISISRRVAWQERPGSQAPKLYRQFSSVHLEKDPCLFFWEERIVGWNHRTADCNCSKAEKGPNVGKNVLIGLSCWPLCHGFAYWSQVVHNKVVNEL